MAFIFPTGLPSGGLIQRGQARVGLATYIAGGVDAVTINDMGGTVAKLDWHYDRKLTDIQVQQLLSPIDAFVSSESLDITATLVHTNLANLQRAFGTMSANVMGAAGPGSAQAGQVTLSGGTPSVPAGTLAIGEDQNTTFFQLFIQSRGIVGEPVVAGQHLRYFQFWKCAVTSIGPMSMAKDTSASVQVKWRAYADTSAMLAGKAALGQFIDS